MEQIQADFLQGQLIREHWLGIKTWKVSLGPFVTIFVDILVIV